jgi:nucleotide-binding universal stress UspA family protein
MTLTTILCPLDFSAASPGLVAYAAALATGTGAALRLLHVVEPAPPSDEERPGTCAGRLAALQAAASEAGATRVSSGLLRGEAATEIVAEAARCQADVIVIAAQGQTGLTRFLMGSTAEAVLRTASCATLLVHNNFSS